MKIRYRRAKHSERKPYTMEETGEYVTRETRNIQVTSSFNE